MTKQGNAEKTEKYRISLVEEESHLVIWQRRFTKTLLWISAVSVAIITFAIFFCIIAFTPLRVAIPGYPDAYTRNAAVQNAIKIDSLENIIARWEIYTDNLFRVVHGEKPVEIDSAIVKKTLEETSPVDPVSLEKKDSLLRDKVIKEGQFGLSGKERDLMIEGLHFFTPLKGVVSRPYDPVMHPYIDISAPAGSVVMTVLDGTVVFAGWNDESGYTIALQHDGNLISVYKHNQKLLKKTGDKLTAGTSIALVGNTGTESSGDHLHFELWHEGEAIDPTQYINF